MMKDQVNAWWPPVPKTGMLLNGGVRPARTDVTYCSAVCEETAAVFLNQVHTVFGLAKVGQQVSYLIYPQQVSYLAERCLGNLHLG